MNFRNPEDVVKNIYPHSLVGFDIDDEEANQLFYGAVARCAGIKDKMERFQAASHALMEMKMELAHSKGWKMSDIVLGNGGGSGCITQ